VTVEQLDLAGVWRPLERDPDPSRPLSRPMRDTLTLLAVASAAHAAVVFVDARPTCWHRRATGRAVLDVNRSTWTALDRRGLVVQGPADGVVRLTEAGQDRVAATTGRAVRERLRITAPVR
jgi:hypothetical protein